MKGKTHPGLIIDKGYEYDIDSKPDEMNQWCEDADFVFNLAGVNRHKDLSEFMPAILALSVRYWTR